MTNWSFILISPTLFLSFALTLFLSFTSSLSFSLLKFNRTLSIDQTLIKLSIIFSFVCGTYFILLNVEHVPTNRVNQNFFACRELKKNLNNIFKHTSFRIVIKIIAEVNEKSNPWKCIRNFYIQRERAIHTLTHRERVMIITFYY